VVVPLLISIQDQPLRLDRDPLVAMTPKLNADRESILKGAVGPLPMLNKDKMGKLRVCYEEAVGLNDYNWIAGLCPR
jgi:hypothetical protein